MKYKIILIIIISIFFIVGCSHQKITDKKEDNNQTYMSYAQPSPYKHKLFSGNLLSGMSDYYYGEYCGVGVTGSILYGASFRIKLPKNISFRDCEFREERRMHRTDFFTITGINASNSGHIIYLNEPIPDRKKGKDKKYICTYGKYEEYVISQNTIKKDPQKFSGQDIYVTYLTFSAFDKKWKQADICFFNGDTTTTISISNYNSSTIKSIVDSLEIQVP